MDIQLTPTISVELRVDSLWKFKTQDETAYQRKSYIFTGKKRSYIIG